MANPAPDRKDRKHYLVLRSRALRAHLIHDARPLAHSIASVESGWRMLGRVRQHPEWLAAAALGVRLLRSARLAALIRGTAFGVRTWRQLLPLLAAVPR